MSTCANCGKEYEKIRRPGGRYQLYCCPECRWEAYRKRRDAKPKRVVVTDDEDKQQRPAGARLTELHAKFIYSPAEDGWPAGCSFPLAEIKSTLALGYFPTGSKFKTKQRKTFTVCGKEAIAADGERIA